MMVDGRSGRHAVSFAAGCADEYSELCTQQQSSDELACRKRVFPSGDVCGVFRLFADLRGFSQPSIHALGRACNEGLSPHSSSLFRSLLRAIFFERIFLRYHEEIREHRFVKRAKLSC